MEFSKRLSVAIDRLWDLAANEHGALPAVDELVDAITEELRAAAPRWRNMESAPRDGDTLVLVALPKRRDLVIGRCEADGTWWASDGELLDTPIAWQPLPAHPKPGEVAP